jgi:hypothetical protein
MTNEIMSTDQPTPLAQMQRAKAIAKEIAGTVGHLIVNIQGRQYPTVAWWQAVGWAFNVTSTEVEVVKQATEDGSTEYMAVVAIVRIDTGETVSRGSAIASSAERAPWGRSAFSVRSMAITRATGRAYRHGCAIIPHLLKIESTPAEEMPIEAVALPALPAATTQSSGSSSVMAMLKQSQLDEQIEGLAGQVSEIAKELGHKISAASARASAEKGSASQEDVRDRLIAKVATGHSKLSEKKASKK